MSEINGAKWTVVTGAAGHLGRQITDRIISSGGAVLGLDIDKTFAVMSSMTEKYNAGNFSYILGDLSDLMFIGKIRELVNEATKSKVHEKPLSGIVNNAAFVGTDTSEGWTTNYNKDSLAAWDSAMSLNLRAPFALCQELEPLLANGSSVVNVASIYGIVAPSWRIYEGTSMNNPAAYGVSKAGLIHLTKWLSSKMAPTTRVNCVSPGGIERKGQDERFKKEYVLMTHLHRMANEVDVVNAISFLLSEQASYITGQNLVVDGGFTSS